MDLECCRCGKSSKRPYCDGTHAKVGFTDEKSEDRVPDKLEIYKGAGLKANARRELEAAMRLDPTSSREAKAELKSL